MVLELSPRVITHPISTKERHFQPDPSELNDFLQEYSPMDISIPPKFYWFIATRFWGADIQTCQKKKALSWGQFILEKWPTFCPNGKT
jgi:hypothetical protein